MKKVMRFVLMSAMIAVFLCVSACAKKSDPIPVFTTMGVGIWECTGESDIEAKHLAAEGMAKIAKSVDDWNWVFICAKHGSELEAVAIQTMTDIAHTPEEHSQMFKYWENIASQSEPSLFDDDNEKLKKAKILEKALNNMVKTAQNVFDWIEIKYSAPEGSYFQKYAAKKIAELTNR